MLASLRDQIRLAVRTLARRPGFAAVTILTLGLGIGATTAIFGVIDALLLRPLPYEDAGHLVWVQNRYQPDGSVGGISGAELTEYRESVGAFEALAAMSLQNGNLTGIDTPLRLRGSRVSREYFGLLRVPFALGRPFTPEEEAPGGPAVIIVSHRLWTAALGSDPDVLGRTLVIDGVPRTVVGVIAARHEPLVPYLFPGRESDYWTPAVIDPATFDAASVEVHNFFVLGRLAEDVTPLAAEAALRPAVARLEARYPGISSAGQRDVAVTPLAARVVGDLGSTLWIILAAVGLLLAVACLNVANMLLARGEARLGDVSVHAALGAGRARLAMQSLAESVLIGLAGGALGVLLAFGAQRALAGLAPPSFPRLDEVGLNLPVLGFCAAVSILSGALAGLLPSLRLARVDPFEQIRASGRTGAISPGQSLLRRGLVVGQVAAAVVMASGAGLLGRTLLELRRVDPGFNPDGLVTFQVNAPRAVYGDQAKIRTLYDGLLERIQAVPGVVSASASWQTPLQAGMSDWPAMAEGGDGEWVGADPNVVTGPYFATWGIERVQGRLFDASDVTRPEGAVILSETAARSLFGDEPAVGRRVNVDFGEPVWREVVGVVRDVRLRGLASDPRPQTYFTPSSVPFSRIPALAVAVRTGGPIPGLAAAVERIMRDIDPDVPLGPLASMDDQIGLSIARERFMATLFTAFAGTALLLGAVGVYGLLAYDVSRRRREIGLRIALGARPSAVLGRVARGALTLGAAGVALGAMGAVASGRLLEGFLYGVSGTDAATLAGVGLFVLFTALLAGLVPARRAARVDPLTALREE